MVALVSVLPQLGPSTRTRPIRDSQGRTSPRGSRSPTASSSPSHGGAGTPKHWLSSAPSAARLTPAPRASRNGDDAHAGSASSARCGTALRSSTGPRPPHKLAVTRAEEFNFLAERMGAWLSAGIEPHAIGW